MRVTGKAWLAWTSGYGAVPSARNTFRREFPLLTPPLKTAWNLIDENGKS
jgi:hypothetical protein